MSGIINLPKESLPFLQRIFGPAAEVGELISEKIRYFRWKSSLKVLKKSEKLAKKYGINPKEVPLRILVPLLEKASLEEETSPLIDKWANLLADASRESGDEKSSFVEILAGLSSQDVKVLESIVSKSLKKKLRDKLQPRNRATSNKELGSCLMIDQAARRQGMLRALVDTCTDLEHDEPTETPVPILVEFFINFIDKFKDYLIIIESLEYIGDRRLDSQIVTAFAQNESVGDNPQSFDILAAKGLINRHSSSAKLPFGTIIVSTVAPSPLGMSFVSSCRGDDLAGDKLR